MSKVGWFRGGGNFSGNRYVIFDDTENPLAQKAQSVHFSRWTQMYDSAKESLIRSLKALTEAERQKESRYLEEKIRALRVIGADEEAESLLMAHSSSRPISAAFKKILEMKDRLTYDYETAFISIDPLERQFLEFLQDYIRGRLEKVTDYEGLSDIAASADMSFSELVERFVDDTVMREYGFDSQEELRLSGIRERVKTDLEEAFLDGIGKTIPKKWVADTSHILTQSVVRDFLAKRVKSRSEKKGKRESLNSRVERMAQTIADSLSSSFTIGSTRRVNTGLVRLSESDLNEIFADTFGVEVSVDSFDDFLKDEVGGIEKNIAKGLEKWKQIYGDIELFPIVRASPTRLALDKTYTLPKLVEMVEGAGELRKSGSFLVDDFAFLLNNIVDGAFAAGSRDEVLEQIGLIAVSLLFKEIEGMVGGQVRESGIHLYGGGDVMYSLSELLEGMVLQFESGLEDLVGVEANLRGEGHIRDTKADYASGNYPYPYAAEDRWNATRSIVEESTVQVKINQAQLQFAGDLLKYLM